MPQVARKKTIAHMPKKTRTALGQQGAAVAQRKRTGGDSPKTRAELYEIAKQRDLPGRPQGPEELEHGCQAGIIQLAREARATRTRHGPR
jgi:hypothetical protein